MSVSSPATPPPLPIDEYLQEIIRLLRSAGAAVVVAAPGAGKTTRIPPAVYRSDLLHPDNPGVIVLQPRRIATRALAARIAAENNWTLGETVGYQVRMENCTTRQTRLIIMTEGILNRRLQSDPALEGIGAVILDEFHMRTLHLDESLAMLVDVRRHLRPDLKLLISSATIDAGPISAFLDAPVMQVPGRTFPVSIQYFSPAGRPSEVVCRDALEEGLRTSEHGHVLVFLPGVFEIQRVARQIAPLAQRNDMHIWPLHGSQPLAEQTAAIAPSPRRKIILATNVAETSITVDGVTLVIDSGLARYADYDPHRGLNRLSTRRISQAAADQRAGRAGRTRPGICIRLWDAAQWKHQPIADPPEITRVDLSHACLDVFSWNPAGFRALNWLTEPPPAHVQSAQEVLRHIAAAHGGGEKFQLTELGRKLVNFPLHPRLSRIILAGIQTGHPAWAVLIAAFLSDGMSQKSDPRAPEGCNLIAHLRHVTDGIADAAGHSRSRDRSVVAVAQLFRRLCRQCRVSEMLPPMPQESVLAGLILTGFPDRLCVIDRRDPHRGVMVGGTGIQLAPRGSVSPAEALIALDIEKNDDRQRLAIVRLAIPISLDQLLHSGAPQIRRETKFIWDDSHRRLSAVLETRFGDLCLKTQPDLNPDWDAARDFIRQHIQGLCRNLLESEGSLTLLCRRVELFRRYNGRAHVPELTAEFLAQAVTDWMVIGRRYELPDTEQIVELFLAQLPHDARYQLNTQLPAYLALASGKRVKVDYTAEGPVIEARLGDFLGTFDSPRLLGGRVTVICRILGPNFRPVQTTSDLAQFWQGSYHQIRKDLRGRYPRHPWPENPLAYVTPRSGRS